MPSLPPPPPPALTQYGQIEPYHPVAWVDPAHGSDSATPQNQVNDPDQPFKTLNAAILAVQNAVVLAWNSPLLIEDRDEIEGTVIALPGIYGPTGGPNGPDASGDDLPILLLDRVHVQGVATDRCIIREYRDTSTATVGAYWPTTGNPCQNASVPIRPLVSVTSANVAFLPPGSIANTPPNPLLPWYDPNVPTASQDATEVFDRFTLQGGTVQVFAQSTFVFPFTPRAVISNCVFDMRTGWHPDPSNPTTAIIGPSFGVMMVKELVEGFQSSTRGYVDQELLIMNNTFVMAQFGVSGWIRAAWDGAVGIIDVSNPYSSGNNDWDADTSQRGLGNAGIINNIFRTEPGSNQRAMVGIDDLDTRVASQGLTPANHTNAFALNRLGSNIFYASSEVGNTGVVAGTALGEDPLWNCAGTTTVFTNCTSTPTSNCTAATLPYPRVDLYDGSTTSTTDRDPGFVGEYLAANYLSDVGQEYPDWRLLPGTGEYLNPMKDKGYAPDAGQSTIAMANGTVFQLPTHSLAPHPFQWDGEGYGNPRIIDGFPDIGHDEIHLLVMTASHSPGSRSHNETGCLNSAAPGGQPKRVMIVRKEAAGITIGDSPPYLVEIHGNHVAPTSNCVGLSAWTQPPATLVPFKTKATLPPDYQNKYIRFTDVSLPTLPWGGTVSFSSTVIYQPLGGLASNAGLEFLRYELTDDESAAGDHWYFANQAEIFDDGGTDVLRSNLQVEYR